MLYTRSQELRLYKLGPMLGSLAESHINVARNIDWHQFVNDDDNFNLDVIRERLS